MVEPKTYKMELTREQVAWTISEDEIRAEHEQTVSELGDSKRLRERAIIDIADALGYKPIKDGEKLESLNVGLYGWIVKGNETYIIYDIIELAKAKNDNKV